MSWYIGMVYYVYRWMIYGYNVFHRPHPVSSSILYVHVSEMLCCPRFPAVVHVSQKLRTFHKPSKNVRVQLYTHWVHSNQQKHWGDQTRSSDMYIIYIYIYVCTYMHIKTLQIISYIVEWNGMNTWKQPFFFPFKYHWTCCFGRFLGRVSRWFSNVPYIHSFSFLFNEHLSSKLPVDTAAPKIG